MGGVHKGQSGGGTIHIWEVSERRHFSLICISFFLILLYACRGIQFTGTR